MNKQDTLIRIIGLALAHPIGIAIHTSNPSAFKTEITKAIKAGQFPPGTITFRVSPNSPNEIWIFNTSGTNQNESNPSDD